MSLSSEWCPNVCLCRFIVLFINVNRNTSQRSCQSDIRAISDMNGVLADCILNKHCFRDYFCQNIVELQLWISNGYEFGKIRESIL